MTWQELIKAFEKERLRNVELIRIAKRIEAGTLTFEQASLYARILGDVLGRLYGETGIFPDGVTEREALTVLKPSLTRAYSVASGPAMAAQEIQNQKFGVPLKAWRPTIKPGRIEGLAVELAMNGYKQEAFTPQVVNLTQSAVDDTMSVNSYNLAKEGYETTYIRETHGDKVCDYCAALVGRHTSKDAPAGYFGHHMNCNCTVKVIGMAKKGKGYAKETNWEKKERKKQVRQEDESEDDEPLHVGENVLDITREYLLQAKPGSGKISFQEENEEFRAFRNSDKDERKAAEWLKSKFGGDIHLRGEYHDKSKKSADYLWRGQLWDLKSPTGNGKNTISAQFRSINHQIERNPGGMLLDITRCSIDVAQIKKDIVKAVNERISYSMDIIVKKGEDVIFILEYKK